MKKLGILVCSVLFSLGSVTAQDKDNSGTTDQTKSQDQNSNTQDRNKQDDHTAQFCATTQGGGGAMIVKKEGNKLTSERTLGNGSVLFTDGVIKRTDGSYYSLKEGECVSKEGDVKHKDSDKKDWKKPTDKDKSDMDKGKMKDKDRDEGDQTPPKD